ncbi:MAG: CAP domain-containing protein, partial [Deltaproteobacteria bacterium]|nr:CAP domain-containing protein [Deltaproteobacteria bacterium]
METEIFDEINTIRLRLGNSPLEWDERIYSAAKAHSVRLRIHKIFSHKDPDGDDVIDRLKGEGLFFLTAAENICGLDFSSNPQQRHQECCSCLKELHRCFRQPSGRRGLHPLDGLSHRHHQDP